MDQTMISLIAKVALALVLAMLLITAFQWIEQCAGLIVATIFGSFGFLALAVFLAHQSAKDAHP